MILQWWSRRRGVIHGGEALAGRKKIIIMRSSSNAALGVVVYREIMVEVALRLREADAPRGEGEERGAGWACWEAA